MLFASIFILSLIYEMVLTLDLNHGLAFTNLSKPLRPHVFFKLLAFSPSGSAVAHEGNPQDRTASLLALSLIKIEILLPAEA